MKTKKELSTLTKRKRGFMYYLKRDWQLYLLLAVPFVMVLIFKYLPMAGLSMAFMDFNPRYGFEGSEWVGFQTFREVFENPEFFKALKNTLTLNLLDLLMGFWVSIALAILLNEIRCKMYKKITQTILYLPHFLSWVIVSALAYQMFSLEDGLVNNLFKMCGMEPVPFLQENKHWLFSYIFLGIWQGMGWGTIIYLAAITGIDAELYEAATVDGAGRWRKIWNITLPCIKGTIVVMLIMSMGRIMGGSFDRVYTLSNSAITDYAKTIPVYVYNIGMGSNRYSPATAIGLFQSVVGVVLVLVSDRIAKLLGEGGII